jgi:hypothetical protein
MLAPSRVATWNPTRPSSPQITSWSKIVAVHGQRVVVVLEQNQVPDEAQRERRDEIGQSPDNDSSPDVICAGDGFSPWVSPMRADTSGQRPTFRRLQPDAIHERL